MRARFAQLFLVANYLLAVVLAAYPPVAPLQGTYTWEVVISDKNGPVTYTGGRTIYDYVSGYVRMESWDTPDAEPGINGITIWDLREVTPVVWTIDENTNCYVQKLNANNTAPPPLDWTGFSLSKVTYFNRALAEEWTDGFGGVVYVDVFSRDVVGMGNFSTVEDGESIFYNIQSWSDKKPDGTNFLLPDTLKCQAIATGSESDSVSDSMNGIKIFGKKIKLGINIKCTACKAAIGVVIGRLCNGLGAAACAPFPPSIPFCAVLASLACKAGGRKLPKDKACKVIKLC